MMSSQAQKVRLLNGVFLLQKRLQQQQQQQQYFYHYNYAMRLNSYRSSGNISLVSIAAVAAITSPSIATSFTASTSLSSFSNLFTNPSCITGLKNSGHKYTTTITSKELVSSTTIASNSNQLRTVLLLQQRGGSTTTTTTSVSVTKRQFALSSSTATTIIEEKDTIQNTEDDNNTMMMGTLTPQEKVDALRAKMKELDLDVYLVPTDDPHLCEYVPNAYMRRAFLTGFTGSAGTAVITETDAYLWTDSRYWNEASMQLDAGVWTMQKAGLPATPTIPKWLGETSCEHFLKTSKTLRIGLDPFVYPASFITDFEKAMKEAISSSADFTDEATKTGEIVLEYNNLIDPIWSTDRPDIPTSPFRIHPIEYAGVTVSEKLSKIRSEMEKKHATMCIFSTLDDVAYLLNVRAKGDIDTCPVGIAYATVTMSDCILYCNAAKVESSDVMEHLKVANVSVKGYDDIIDDIKAHCSTSTEGGTSKTKIWIDKSRSNLAIASVIPDVHCIDSQNPITPMKAAKNEAELNGMREAHIVDGVAMAHFIAWLENKIIIEGTGVSEVEIDEVLTGYRAQQKGFVELSFPTIAGVGPNGAIIHYRAERNDIMRTLDRSAPLLLDSGGQYTYGTTDVTRTWSFQEQPDPAFVQYYTRVLKGHIGVDQMIFPENTPGFVLDVYARRALWEIGKDYGHGTGHGVGAALNVHEGPISISPRFANLEGLKRGMVVSNEPGYYEDGNFGIRIENLLEIQYVNPEYNVEEDPATVNGDAPKSSTEKKFLKFGRLTQIPIQKNLIDVSLMTVSELDWLDSYHEEVLRNVGPRLEKDSPAMAWLLKSCEKIDRSKR